MLSKEVSPSRQEDPCEFLSKNSFMDYLPNLIISFFPRSENMMEKREAINLRPEYQNV